MREAVQYAVELGGPLGILLLVLCGLGAACWYALVRLLGKNDGIITRNANEIKNEFVRFLKNLDTELQTLSAFHESQDKGFAVHCTQNQRDHFVSHQALEAILSTILAIIQSQEVLTNGEKKRAERLLMEAIARLEIGAKDGQ
jgi:hypothetical protein